MSPNLAHPDARQLAEFASGEASEEAAIAISGHLSDCASCRTVVEKLPDDTLLELLRGPASSPEDQKPLPPDLTPTMGAETQTFAGPLPVVRAKPEVPTDLTDHPRYRVQKLIGAGGMGAVYHAEHRLMERQVALKVLNSNLMNRPGMVERFEREVKAAARLVHPHIVTAYDADQAGDTHFLAMEFVEGVSLADHVHRQGPLPAGEACTYIHQAALGLQHASECGMVHRDIKPHNLMLTLAGRVKILDFGLARFVRETAPVIADAEQETSEAVPHSAAARSLTQLGVVMGTADFIAPEQARDPRRADIRADIYSLGCTLYYLLTGKAPFPDGTVVEKLAAHLERAPAPLAKRRSDLPAGLARVVERMMAKDPARRYQTPADVAEALRPFTTAAVNLRRRVRRVIATALGSAAALVLAAAVVYVQTDKGEFVVKAESDKVALMLNENGLKIRDVTANREYQLNVGRHNVRTGDYEIDVRELPAGLEIKTQTFSIKRGGEFFVTVTFNVKSEPGYLKDEALRWFPADAKFFYAHNFEVFPGFAELSLNIMGENLRQDRDRFWRFKDYIGRIDRVSFADAVNHERPGQSRLFTRFTGDIKANRLIDYFKQEWPGVVIEVVESAGDKITLIHDPREDNGVFGGAFAIVGETDLVFAAHGPDKKDIEAVRECLELRAGRGVCLPEAKAAALAEIPANAWVFCIGEPPRQIKKHYADLIMQARSFIASMSGTSDVEVQYRGLFDDEPRAKLFVLGLNLMKQTLLSVPLVTKNAELSAAVTTAVNSLQVRSDGDRVAVSVQLPADVWGAILKKLQDTPLQQVASPPAAVTTKPSAAAPAATHIRDPGYIRGEALRWFPADVTYFTVQDMQAAPQFSRLQLLLMAEVEGSRFREFLDLMGRVDRLAIAFTEHPEQPDQSRFFMRFSGAITPNRLLDFFRREWPTVIVEQVPSSDTPVVLVDHSQSSKGVFGGALALVGTTDVILAGRFGPSKGHLEVIRECLALRGGQGASLPVAQAKALEEIPVNAWGLSIGEPPAFFKENLFTVMRPVRSFVMWVAGNTDLQIRFRGAFASEMEAKAFGATLQLMMPVFLNAPVVANNRELSAAVSKVVNDLQIKVEAERVTLAAEIPSVAWTALLERLADTPLKELVDTPALNRSTDTKSAGTVKDLGTLRGEALRWFPADTTFFQAQDMQAFPELAQLTFLLVGEMAPDEGSFWKFKELIGQIDRLSTAAVENRAQPDQSRWFTRLSGAITPNRLVDYFRRDWPSAAIERTEVDGVPVVLVSEAGSKKGVMGGAFAIVGTTDLIWAGYVTPDKPHLDVVRQALDLRAGKGSSLLVAQAKTLQELPEDAWGFMAGQAPTGLKDYMPGIQMLARSFVMSFSGTDEIAIRFRGSFATEAEAKLFTTTLNLIKSVSMAAPAVVNSPELSAAAAKTFASLRIEAEGDRITASIHVPQVAWRTLLQKMRDMPFKEFKDPPALKLDSQR